MNIIAEHDGKLFGSISIERASDFVPPFAGHPYACLIWDHDGRLPTQEMSLIAITLIDTGCRLAVCGGERGTIWDDVIDEDFVMKHLDHLDEALETADVMTTWHDGESPDEVAYFFVHYNDYAREDFTRYLILHVGSSPAKSRLDYAVRVYALNEAAPE